MYENFIRAIEAKGITPPAEIIADGEIHRFDSDHSGKSNGARLVSATPAIKNNKKAKG